MLIRLIFYLLNRMGRKNKQRKSLITPDRFLDKKKLSERWIHDHGSS